jgi:hypothetical protein
MLVDLEDILSTINAIRTIRLALGNNPLVITGGAQKTLTVFC